MEIIDLSQPLYDGMEVYPGDPEVHIYSFNSGLCTKSRNNLKIVG